ncbi:MAG: hypothetical protein K9M49_05830 [Candidatus Marinimicrobia bacterium]|nr:hypothetical protein [Candidatus Neomarinimicrobiota bacterium]MCF7851402.1 hypothetical protein [Candidatus Neomarinimicrobiota bacterium]MCF7904653.1 hypothetical protein [Candidatus Neomarinimicrobiota bacterium]
MSLFEYIMVLTSILIGLGVAELLSGVVRMLRTDFKEGFYLPQILWAIYLFFYLIIVWWSRWDLRVNFHWTFFQLIMSLAGPLLAFVLAGLVFPRSRPAREYYFRQQKTFFGLLPIIMLIGLFHEYLIEGTPLLSMTTVLASSMLVLSLIPRFVKRDWIHILCGLAANLIFFSWVYLSVYLLSS